MLKQKLIFSEHRLLWQQQNDEVAKPPEQQPALPPQETTVEKTQKELQHIEEQTQRDPAVKQHLEDAAHKLGAEHQANEVDNEARRISIEMGERLDGESPERVRPLAVIAALVLVLLRRIFTGRPVQSNPMNVYPGPYQPGVQVPPGFGLPPGMMQPGMLPQGYVYPPNFFNKQNVAPPAVKPPIVDMKPPVVDKPPSVEKPPVTIKPPSTEKPTEPVKPPVNKDVPPVKIEPPQAKDQPKIEKPKDTEPPKPPMEQQKEKTPDKTVEKKPAPEQKKEIKPEVKQEKYDENDPAQVRERARNRVTERSEEDRKFLTDLIAGTQYRIATPDASLAVAHALSRYPVTIECFVRHLPDVRDDLRSIAEEFIGRDGRVILSFEKNNGRYEQADFKIVGEDGAITDTMNRYHRRHGRAYMEIWHAATDENPQLLANLRRLRVFPYGRNVEPEDDMPPADKGIPQKNVPMKKVEKINPLENKHDKQLLEQAGEYDAIRGTFIPAEYVVRDPVLRRIWQSLRRASDTYDGDARNGGGVHNFYTRWGGILVREHIGGAIHVYRNEQWVPWDRLSSFFQTHGEQHLESTIRITKRMTALLQNSRLYMQTHYGRLGYVFSIEGPALVMRRGTTERRYTIRTTGDGWYELYMDGRHQGMLFGVDTPLARISGMEHRNAEDSLIGEALLFDAVALLQSTPGFTFSQDWSTRTITATRTTGTPWEGRFTFSWEVIGSRDSGQEVGFMTDVLTGRRAQVSNPESIRQFVRRGLPSQ